MKRDYRDYLMDIIESIEKIEEFTKDLTLARFTSDEKTQLVVVKSLEISGNNRRSREENPAFFEKEAHGYSLAQNLGYEGQTRP